MLSNDVAALGPGETCEALLLTAKARLIAPLRVLRRGHEDFLLLTEPELGERCAASCCGCASRPAARSSRRSTRRISSSATTRAGSRRASYGVPAVEVLDEPEPPDAVALDPDELERLRIRARTPRWGRELDDRVLPAEAGLTETHVSFTKGCYPGQEPIARLHYRGKANRGLRVLELEGAELPAYDAPSRRSATRPSAA